ncbi:hypothetical protein CNO18_12505 [Gordonia sp. 1D]|nr:hypothetical protein CNO18_12505 [Gordonia sp. 1D]
MTTPFSDDSLLPKPAPAMPVSPHGNEHLLRSERAQWERRAAVATDAAAELDMASKLLRGVAWNNYLGECTEGIGVYGALRSAVVSLREQVSHQADTAMALGNQCSTAASEIDDADRHGAAGIAT